MVQAVTISSSEKANSANNMIKNVIFDIGNVLTDYGFMDFIRSYGYSEDMCDRIAKAAMLSPHWKEYDRGVLTDDEIVDLFVSMDPDIEADIRRVHECLTGLVTGRDYAVPWIEDLKARGLSVYYLSNFSNKAFVDCADALDFLPYMDGGVFSYRVKQIKPDIDIYQTLLEKYDLKPEECVFIDDLKDNIISAESLGINTILFTSYDNVAQKLLSLL